MNLSPRDPASFRMPEKFDDESVTEDSTSIKTTSPGRFSRTMSTSIWPLSRYLREFSRGRFPSGEFNEALSSAIEEFDQTAIYTNFTGMSGLMVDER